MEPIRLSVKQDSLVILRMNLSSRVMAPVVIQPKLENWVRQDGSILHREYKISPSYVFLQTGSKANITFTFKVPEAEQGETLYGAISIPSAENYLFPILLEINNEAILAGHVFDFSIDALIPPEIKEESEPTNYLNSRETLKFIAGLASLEVIPSKWLVAELIIQLCGAGYEFSQTEKGSDIANRLKKTRVFKNGSLMFRAAQIPQWVNLANSVTVGLHNLSKSDQEQIGILTGWEVWLYNLIHQDIESPDFKHSEILIPKTGKTTKILELMELDPEKWFLYVILGLFVLSPRVKELLSQVVEKVENIPDEPIIEVKLPKNVIDENGSLQR